MSRKQRLEYTLTNHYYLSLIIFARLQTKNNNWPPAI